MVLTDGTLSKGKYSGKRISDPEVTAQYLRFLYWQCDFGAAIDDAIGRELARRKEPLTDATNNQQSCDAARDRRAQEQRAWRAGQGRGHAPITQGSLSVNKDIFAEIITAGRQALAKRNHPDVGGDSEKMKSINIAADAALEWVRRS
jgi:hypothetical protein